MLVFFFFGGGKGEREKKPTRLNFHTVAHTFFSPPSLFLTGVIFEGILLKPSMVTPGADCPKRETPERVAEYTLKLLRRRVPPAVPGIMFLSGGQSELEATLNLNAMNQQPNPWHVSFSYARALQNSVLRTWQGNPANKQAAQEALLVRAKANSDAQLGKYDSSNESADAGKSLYEAGYKY